MSEVQYLIEESKRFGLSLNQDWAERLLQACKADPHITHRLDDETLDEDDGFEGVVWEFIVPNPTQWPESNIWDADPVVRNHFLDQYEAVLRTNGILNEQTFPNYRAMHAERSYTSDTTRVTPDCCDGIRLNRSIYLRVKRERSGVLGSPFWVVFGQSQYEGGWWVNEAVSVNFCPHCGKKLPDIELRPTQRNICTPDESGDYCSICTNRLRSCTCAPPAWRWRPVSSPVNPDPESP